VKQQAAKQQSKEQMLAQRQPHQLLQTRPLPTPLLPLVGVMAVLLLGLRMLL
jgi:hypothetical protein